MSLEDLEPFGYEWQMEQNERIYGEAPYEGAHATAHREARQLGLSCPFDCDPDGNEDWEPEVRDAKAQAEWDAQFTAAVAADPWGVAGDDAPPF